jgi:carbohydrate esterase-like sialic acid-specific acetylesterase
MAAISQSKKRRTAGATAAVAVACLATFGVLALTAGPAGAAAVPRDLIIVAGQSNATGQESYAVDPTTGTNDVAAPFANGADSSSTITWWQSYVSPNQQGQVDDRQFVPVPLDTPQTSTVSNRQVFGPELGLARQIYHDTGQPVTVVKVAFAATSIDQWSPQRSDSLYFDLTRAVRQTMANDLKAGYEDNVAGILWYQGETDASEPAKAVGYQNSLGLLLKAFRENISSSAPIVLAKEDISITCALAQMNCSGNAMVRAADDWAATNLPNIYEVDTAGLPRTGLGVHLSNQGELELGEEVAAFM